MAIKQYWLAFGSGNPQLNAGLIPSFLTFQAATGLTLNTGFTTPVGYTSLTSPPVYEYGVSTGIYTFSYDMGGQTFPIVFVIDGSASLTSANRYIANALDPLFQIDQKIGYLTDSYGSTALDPASVLGYLRRALEFLEGVQIFTKPTGVWNIFDRGATLLLREHLLTNTSTNTTRE